jgi:phenylpropionate dioxygenase-like ring-hydroxylating dioxygenase large terminal subunit
MLTGRGNTQCIVCPIHRWTYDLGGKQSGAPHFREPAVRAARPHAVAELEGAALRRPARCRARSFASSTLDELDFSGHLLNHVELHECRYNWKTFIEVYLEDYHVEPFHPGLGSFVTCEDLRWEFADLGVRAVRRRPQRPREPGTRTYERWHKAVLDYYRGEQPPHGAIWLTYYPNIMVEWYPHVLVISTLIPRRSTAR